MDRMIQLQNQISTLRQNLSQISQMAAYMSQSERNNQVQLEHLAQAERNATQQLQQIQQMCNSLSQQLGSISTIDQQYGANYSTQAFTPSLSGNIGAQSYTPGYFTQSSYAPTTGFSGIGTSLSGIGGSLGVNANIPYSGFTGTSAYNPTGFGIGTYQYPRVIPGIGTSEWTTSGLNTTGMNTAGIGAAGFGTTGATQFPTTNFPLTSTAGLGAANYGMTTAAYNPAGFGAGTYQYPRVIPGIGNTDWVTSGQGTGMLGTSGIGASTYLPFSGTSTGGFGSNISHTAALGSGIGAGSMGLGSTAGLGGFGASTAMPSSMYYSPNYRA